MKTPRNHSSLNLSFIHNQTPNQSSVPRLTTAGVTPLAGAIINLQYRLASLPNPFLVIRGSSKSLLMTPSLVGVHRFREIDTRNPINTVFAAIGGYQCCWSLQLLLAVVVVRHRSYWWLPNAG